MEIFIIACFIIIIMLIVILNSFAPKDNRESYLRSPSGRAYALCICGDYGNLINHEAIIHDGTPHQNPHIEIHTRVRFRFFIPYSVDEEIRYYPLTIGASGVIPDIEAIEKRCEVQRKQGHNVRVVELTYYQERMVARLENIQQEIRGVMENKLTYKKNGRKR